MPLDKLQDKEKSTISLFSTIQSNNSNSSLKLSPRLNIIKSRSPTNVPKFSQSVNRFNQKGIVPTKSSSYEDKITSSTLRTDIIPTKSNSFEDKSADINIELCTPKVTSKSDDTNNRSTADISKVNKYYKNGLQLELKDETPNKLFQIPSARRIPSSHRLLSSNTSQKCRSVVDEEFRSQKILFTTPTAVPRPTFQLMSNLGLDDSLNCYKSSPMATNLSAVKEVRNFLKPKEQLNIVDRVDDAKNPPKPIQHVEETKQPLKRIDIGKSVNENHPSDNNFGVIIKPSQDGEGVAGKEDKQSIIRINGKDFIIQKKIGQGGSSSVYLAEHKETKLECALKVSL